MNLSAVLFCLFIVAISQAQVDVSPSGVFVSYPGGQANFVCSSVSGSSGQVITRVLWRSNETIFTGEEDFIRTEYASIGGGVGTLTFTNVSTYYNNTEISCEAFLASGVSYISNSATLLVLQGRLTPVVNLTVNPANSTFYLTWDPPFTKDIRNVHPDITGYCVFAEVRDYTSSSTFFTMCGINETEIAIPMPERLNAGCDRYIFSVTGVNVVGNGTLSRIPTMEMMTPTRLESVSYGDSTSDVEESNSFTLSLTMSAPVCCAKLTFQDNYTDERVVVECEDLIIMGNTISLDSSLLRVNRHYLVTVAADNRAGEAISTTDISTHGIMDVGVREVGAKLIFIETSYFTHSSANGVLYRLLYLTGDGQVDFSKSLTKVLRRDSSNVTVLPGQYIVLGYDIEQDGRLLTGEAYPAVVRELVKTGNSSQGTTLPPLLSNIESCSVSIDRFSIEAQCTYPSNSPATGFQMIAGSSDHKLYVEQTTHTTATVEVEETGVYQVSIFPLREGTGILDSNVEYTQQVTISNLVPTVTEPTDVTTEGLLDEGGSSMGIAIGVVLGVAGFLALTIMVVCIIVTIKCPQCCRSCKSGGKSDEEAQTQKHSVIVDPAQQSTPDNVQENDEYKEEDDDTQVYDEESCHFLPKNNKSEGSHHSQVKRLSISSQQRVAGRAPMAQKVEVEGASLESQPQKVEVESQPQKVEVESQPQKVEVESQPQKVEVEGASLESQPQKVEVESQPQKVEVESQPQKVEVESQPQKVEVESQPQKVEVESQPQKVEVESQPQKVEVESQPQKVEVESQTQKVEVESQTQKVEVEGASIDSQPQKNAEGAFIESRPAKGEVEGASVDDALLKKDETSGSNNSLHVIAQETTEIAPQHNVIYSTEVSEQGLYEAHFVDNANRWKGTSEGKVIVPGYQTSTVQFKPVTSGTPEPRSRTPEHPEVVSDNKCFTKVNPDEETSKDEELRRRSHMPQLQTMRTEGAMTSELNPPPSTPELERIASSSNFRDCPSFPADTGDIVEQDVSVTPTTRQNSAEVVPPPISPPQQEPNNVQPSSPTTSEPASEEGLRFPPIINAEASQASEESDTTAEQVVATPKSPAVFKYEGAHD